MRTALLFLVLSTLALASVASEPLGALRGVPSAYTAPGWTRAYPVYDETFAVVGTHSWRVANNTGNCCENHLTATPTGRLYDLGENQPVFSDDGGLTWKSIATVVNPVNGEGSGAYAPNGDFVGMSWDPYSGDRVVTFKHEAATDQWYLSVVALHSPFFDRPWLGVVPGPFQHNGETVPYLSLMMGGWPQPLTYVSYDGLTYLELEQSELTPLLGVKRAWLDQPAVAWADWVQPITHARIVPLPAGGALYLPTLGCNWARLDPDGSTGCFSFPNGTVLPANGAVRFDSLGRVHTFTLATGGFNHRMSDDGGRSWQTRFHPLPANHAVDSFDVVVNGALDAAAVGFRLDNTVANPDYSRILVYKIGNLSGVHETRVFQVGNADRYLTSGVTSTSTRMDFMTVAMLPDGRIAASFSDLAHASPRVAVQVTP